MSGKKGVEFLKKISDFMVKAKGYDSVMKKVGKYTFYFKSDFTDCL